MVARSLFTTIVNHRTLSVGLEYGIKPLSEESRAKLFWSDWLFLGWGQILIHEIKGYIEYLSQANVNMIKS